jgi:hypothetical protein
MMAAFPLTGVLFIWMVVVIARGSVVGPVELAIGIIVAAVVLRSFMLGPRYEWGRTADGALRLADDHFLLWPGARRVRRVRYDDLAAVRHVDLFGKQTAVRICHREEGSAEPLQWLPVLTWEGEAPVANALAAELARRAGLTQHSPGSWARGSPQELPPLPPLG